jgi:hypothetical protein
MNIFIIERSGAQAQLENDDYGCTSDGHGRNFSTQQIRAFFGSDKLLSTGA